MFIGRRLAGDETWAVAHISRATIEQVSGDVACARRVRGVTSPSELVSEQGQLDTRLFEVGVIRVKI